MQPFGGWGPGSNPGGTINNIYIFLLLVIFGVQDMIREIGEVFSYYSGIGVAIVKLTGSIKKGDKIQFKGHTTNFEQVVNSMQINHKKIDSAKKGDDLGLKVDDRVRPGDKIYKV